MGKILCMALLLLTALHGAARAQTLDSSNVTIEWQVVNRFRLFRDPAFFKLHENA